MKRKVLYSAWTLLIVIAAACGSKKDKYEASACFSPEEQKRLLTTIVHYCSRLAPESTHETKFNKEFDWYYDKAVQEAQIMYCHEGEKENTYSILIARKARSITPMEEGLAITFSLDDKKQIQDYNEVFRMWKMPHDTLSKRGLFLFKTMLNGGDLTLYHSKFQQDRFIEFPDDRFSFDRETKRWRDNVMDTVRIRE